MCNIFSLLKPYCWHDDIEQMIVKEIIKTNGISILTKTCFLLLFRLYTAQLQNAIKHKIIIMKVKHDYDST